MAAPDRSEWIDLIPHAGAMALVDAVLACDPDRILARSDNHRSPGHPLRRAGQLHAIHLCEYGAQAMAVHGALIARAAGGRARPGLLVALRAVELTVDRIDRLPGALLIDARREHADAGAWLYRFQISHGADTLARGQAMVMLERGSDDDGDGHG
jgi:predicted hotdog family 3-hydroxylacyl-ACP dehydratase